MNSKQNIVWFTAFVTLSSIVAVMGGWTWVMFQRQEAMNETLMREYSTPPDPRMVFPPFEQEEVKNENNG